MLLVVYAYESCRVKKEINKEINTQNKELHPLVNLIAINLLVFKLKSFLV